MQQVQHLSAIIGLQKMLKTNFDGKLDINVVSKYSVKEFIIQNSLNEWIEIIKEYLELLESLKTFIFENVGVYGFKAKAALQGTHCFNI